MKRILVLYRELAGYFVHCLNHLCDNHQMVADVVAYPVHADAPFQFGFSDRITCWDRAAIDVQALEDLHSAHPYDLIFCGGWSDQVYLEFVKRHSEVPSLLGFDNQWRGSAKQYLAACYARLFIAPRFTMAFVPGPEQAQFARKMGFSKIVQGAYCCDTEKFGQVHYQRNRQHWESSEKVLCFVGRYASEKFIQELQVAFLEASEAVDRPWKLLCAGTGPLWENRTIHPSIEHAGFLQPQDLLQHMTRGHAFVLPSSFEPWGVVVHEFAAAGYPLVLSDAVGARHAFLQSTKNGFVFRHGQIQDLKSAMVTLMNTDSQGLFEMSQQSSYLAQQITPTTWAQGVLKLLEP